jgi:hypothetical protein
VLSNEILFWTSLTVTASVLSAYISALIYLIVTKARREWRILGVFFFAIFAKALELSSIINDASKS